MKARSQTYVILFRPDEVCGTLFRVHAGGFTGFLVVQGISKFKLSFAQFVCSLALHSLFPMPSSPLHPMMDPGTTL
jgi:hypothetical protein